MAVELQGFDVGILKASADLSDYQFHGVKISATDFTAEPATAGAADGVLQNKPAAAGRTCQIRRSGLTKVVLGGTVVSGYYGKTDASAHFVQADTDQDRYIVKFLEGGDSGDTVTAILECGFYAT